MKDLSNSEIEEIKKLHDLVKKQLDSPQIWGSKETTSEIFHRCNGMKLTRIIVDVSRS